MSHTTASPVVDIMYLGVCGGLGRMGLIESGVLCCISVAISVAGIVPVC
jgi:hypothetical protein